MTLKTFFAACALALLPGFAIAAGCSESRQAMSCPEGQMWDHETGACAPVVTG